MYPIDSPENIKKPEAFPCFEWDLQESLRRKGQKVNFERSFFTVSEVTGY